MRLRQLKEADADGMLEWMHDPEIQKFFRTSMETKTREEVMDFIHNANTVPVEGNSIHFAIADEDDSYLGTVSLKDFDFSSRSAEYAISLRKCAQGRGIAYQATREILKMAFETFHLQRIFLNVLEDNLRAIHLYEKLGFTYEGAFRHYLFLNGEYKTLRWYSMLENEWKENSTT